jgi:hypothetical protein
MTHEGYRSKCKENDIIGGTFHSDPSPYDALGVDLTGLAVHDRYDVS